MTRCIMIEFRIDRHIVCRLLAVGQELTTGEYNRLGRCYGKTFMSAIEDALHLWWQWCGISHESQDYSPFIAGGSADSMSYFWPF